MCRPLLVCLLLSPLAMADEGDDAVEPMDLAALALMVVIGLLFLTRVALQRVSCVLVGENEQAAIQIELPASRSSA